MSEIYKSEIFSYPKVASINLKEIDSWDLLHLRQNDIIIIDNFSHQPEYIRSLAISMDYSTKYTDTGYKYNFTIPPDKIINESKDILFRVLGNDIEKFLLSYFVFETKKDELKTKQRNWIHYDPWSWVGLHYLNLPNQSIGGTSFYKNKKTNSFGFKDFNDENKQLIADEGTIEENWIEYFRVDLRWNRLVLFRPCFFHSPTCYFGDNIENARIYKLLTFN